MGSDTWIGPMFTTSGKTSDWQNQDACMFGNVHQPEIYLHRGTKGIEKSCREGCSPPEKSKKIPTNVANDDFGISPKALQSLHRT